MASFTDEQQIIRQEFTIAHEFFNWAKHEFFANVPSFNIRSWGMSDDYPIALECGSNMVRVGTKNFRRARVLTHLRMPHLRTPPCNILTCATKKGRF